MPQTLTAADVVGRYLIAKKDVPVYDGPFGTRIGTIKKGNSTAEVYSYIVRQGQVFWVFDYTVPGQTPSAYYALQSPDAFSLSSVPGNVVIAPNVLPSVDVFPSGGQLKTIVLYGIIGLLALRLLKK
jgi:hypothetical protein